MTVPMAYRLAAERFHAFLADAAEEAGLVTTNQAYTMVQGVLQAFRRRLSPEEGIAFAQGLPPLLQALFVDGWDPRETPVTNWDRTEMTREVQSLRRHHNFAPHSSIRDVAAALRRHVDATAFESCLARLSPEARDFWIDPGSPVT